jgi:peptidoglycan/LPS O-acetylase OafA/YrhL
MTMTRSIILDAARCIAIVLLLLAHIGQTLRHPVGGFFGIPDFYCVSLGGLAVTLFLLISGTVLERQYGQKHIKYIQFIVKRCLRIYPVYYMSLPIGIVIFFLRSYYDTGHWLESFSKLGIGDIVLTVSGGYAFAGQWGGPFVATSWFIALIMTMYLLFPFLSRAIKKRPASSFCLLLLISFLSRFILGRYDILPQRPLDWFPLCRIFEFSLGIYLAILLPKRWFNDPGPSLRSGSWISLISEISFPLFLAHYPLLSILRYLIVKGFHPALPICFFLLLSLTASWLILSIDRKLPRSLMMKKIDEIYAGSTTDG